MVFGPRLRGHLSKKLPKPVFKAMRRVLRKLRKERQKWKPNRSVILVDIYPLKPGKRRGKFD